MRIDNPANAQNTEGIGARSSTSARNRVDYETRLQEILNQLRAKHGKAPHVPGESVGAEEIPSMSARLSGNDALTPSAGSSGVSKAAARRTEAASTVGAAGKGESEYDRKVRTLAEKAGISLLGKSMPVDEHWSRVRQSLAILRAHSQGVEAPQGITMPEMRGTTKAQDLARSIRPAAAETPRATPIEEAVEAALAAEDEAEDTSQAETPAPAPRASTSRPSASGRAADAAGDAHLHSELGQSIDRIEATLDHIPNVTI